MTLLLALLLIPLAAVAMIVLGKSCPRASALAAAWVNLALAVYLAVTFLVVPDMVGARFELNWLAGKIPGLPEIRFHLGLDGISLLLVLLAAIVTVAAVAVTPKNIQRPRAFFASLLMISLGCLGAFLSLDLFWMYVFHELALIPTFFLVGIWGGPRRGQAAYLMTLYLMLGSLVLLAGILALVLALPESSRTFDLPRLATALHEFPLSARDQALPSWLILIGAGTLVSLFPFHSWAPIGYAEAPAPAAMLHAGVLKKFGLYLLLRLWPLLPLGFAAWQPVLLWLLAGNLLIIGLVTIAQKKLGYLLGYSSVMHMGYLFLGLAAWNALSVHGVAMLALAHGLSAALLFALRGELLTRTGTDTPMAMGGLAKAVPFLTTVFCFGAFASMGLPGLANFPGELAVFFGAWRSGLTLTTLAALWGVVLSAVYLLRAVQGIFFGQPATAPASNALPMDISPGSRWPFLLLTGSLLLFGVLPGILTTIIRPSIEWLMQGGAL